MSYAVNIVNIVNIRKILLVVIASLALTACATQKKVGTGMTLAYYSQMFTREKIPWNI